tara:strand:- start:44 stop:418 length:375 start_codon:yes stop_codon:yes gene_type:complete
MKLVALILSTALISGCGARNDLRQPYSITPASVAAKPLDDVTSFPARLLPALLTAREYLAKNGDDPADFYVGEISEDSGEVELPLWHVTAFEREQAAVGNPGGKSRTLRYDPESRKITSELYWQ